MITVFGDVHGHIPIFRDMIKKVPEDHTIIQVGDMGIWPNSIRQFELGFPRPVYFIDGNHEFFPYLNGISEIREIHPNLFYVPRGTVTELDGRKILFLGGAESPDKQWRTPGVSWFPEESITQADLYRIPEDVETVDLMITHTPPYSVIHHLKGGDTPDHWNRSSKVVESVWTGLDKPPLVCGHMHFRKTVGVVEILPELGTLEI